MDYTPRPPRRTPRPDELAFLVGIAANPPSLAVQGPVGRCSKRGWCELLLETNDGRQVGTSELKQSLPQERPEVVRTVGYVLTEEGRQAAGLAAISGGATPSRPGSKPVL